LLLLLLLPVLLLHRCCPPAAAPAAAAPAAGLCLAALAGCLCHRQQLQHILPVWRQPIAAGRIHYLLSIAMMWL